MGAGSGGATGGTAIGGGGIAGDGGAGKWGAGGTIGGDGIPAGMGIARVSPQYGHWQVFPPSVSSASSKWPWGH
ncbi:MAG: hypothetical protein QGH11_09760 [Pirellulaceae bacterium]|nr:hypothetical protein [Pirellulaceae bacterium]